MINLSECKLFENFSDNQLASFISIADGKTMTFKQKNPIYSAGNKIDYFGIILSGSLNVLNITSDGEENLMFTLNKGDMVCESACFTELKKLPFSIVAKCDASIYFIKQNIIFSHEFIAKDFYPLFIKNFMTVLAEKNVSKSKKLDILSRRTTKDKVLTYLINESKIKGEKTFYIPFNREELATFLAVERTALSKVLSQMNKENIIRFHKNKFTLLL